jgi:hypothetical protein
MLTTRNLKMSIITDPTVTENTRKRYEFLNLDESEILGEYST